MKKRVLIIDDDPVLRKLLRFGLERAGYEISTADHGGQAMALVGEEKFDLVLVDLMMPVVDGLRFLRWLREEARLDVPAVVFSSYDRKKIPEDMQAAGATDFVAKPVQLPELLSRVSRLLGE